MFHHAKVRAFEEEWNLTQLGIKLEGRKQLNNMFWNGPKIQFV